MRMGGVSAAVPTAAPPFLRTRVRHTASGRCLQALLSLQCLPLVLGGALGCHQGLALRRHGRGLLLREQRLELSLERDGQLVPQSLLVQREQLET